MINATSRLFFSICVRTFEFLPSELYFATKMAELSRRIKELEDAIAASCDLQWRYETDAAFLRFKDQKPPKDSLQLMVVHEGGKCCRQCLLAFNPKYVRCHSRELYLIVVSVRSVNLADIPKKYRQDREIILASIAKYGDNLRFAPDAADYYMAAVK